MYKILILESHTDEVIPTLYMEAKIQKMALSLYLGESDLVSFTCSNRYFSLN